MKACPKCIFPNYTFPKCIFPTCIFQKFIFQKCIFQTIFFPTAFLKTVLFQPIFFKTTKIQSSFNLLHSKFVMRLMSNFSLKKCHDIFKCGPDFSLEWWWVKVWKCQYCDSSIMTNKGLEMILHFKIQNWNPQNKSCLDLWKKKKTILFHWIKNIKS